MYYYVLLCILCGGREFYVIIYNSVNQKFLVPWKFMIFGKLKLLINISQHVLGITKHTKTFTHIMMCAAEKLVNVCDVAFENKK